MQHNTVDVSTMHIFAPEISLCMTCFQPLLGRFLAKLCVCLFFIGQTSLLLAAPVSADSNPEAATGSQAKQLVRAKHYMAAAANPLATEAGRAILREGGSAVDAAIAMQLVLGLVEPQSSGLGGGAFMVVFNAKHKQLETIDGRETAPLTATPDRFMQDGRAMPFMQAVNSGKSVGTPGLLRALELAHQRHGKLKWARLFDAAILLAEEGFTVSPRLHMQIANNKDLLEQTAARSYFYVNGGAHPVGTRLKNPAYAEVLRRVAAEGVSAFYQGSIATKIVAAVREHERAGDLSLEDLAEYRAKVREPVCSVIRVYKICGMGPPSSGGIAVLQMLGMLQQHHLEDMQPNSLAAVHYFSEAGRLAFADRDRYVADPDFITVPVHALLAPDYLQRRGALIDSRFSMGRATAGELPLKLSMRGMDHAADLPSTTHMVSIDQQGNAVSMTSTIEFEFGSKIFVQGFLLNNQLTDFSLTPTDQTGALIANRVEAGKRPRSSMAPLIVLKDKKPFLLLGSPGGSAIINYVAKTLIGVIDWQLDVQQAIALPNMGSRNKETELERGTVLEKHQSDLQAMGHRVTIMPFPSGVQAIMSEKNGLSGGADPRREGSASGD